MALRFGLAPRPAPEVASGVRQDVHQQWRDTEPFERVMERTVRRTVVRPVPIAGWVPPSATAAPPASASARAWVELLGELGAQLADDRSPVAREHWQHRRLYDSLVCGDGVGGRAHLCGSDRLSGH
jgi:hypothetical protein